LEQSELEKLIEELEQRVDRLRSLYEQYFMGLEKVVPAVAQKDVERRFYVLRRQTIRNTALRFRFQNVLLKYNTYQNYWMRITRQIEEGTYKRDVRRAKARFGTAAGGKQKERDRERETADGKAPELDELDLDVEVDLDAELSSFEDEEIARAQAEVARMRAALQGNRPMRGAQPVAAPRPPAPTLHDSLDDPGLPTERPSPVRLSEPFVEPATEPKIAAAKPAGLTYAVRGAQGGGKLPPSLPIAGPKSEPPPVSVARPRPAPIGPPSAARPLPQPSIPQAAPSRRLSSRPAPPKATSKPPPRPPSMRPRARPNAPPPPSNLSDERVRQIYTQYVETKRKVGESTAAITYESLSRSLRDSSEKLKQKHGGKNVDFEVAVKDGKAILRPIVK